jgi:alcohol dehydrogenase
MRSLVLTGPGRLGWEETTTPAVHNDGEALVTPLAASRCNFDRLLLRGAIPVPFPFALGHEAVARVLEVGPAVQAVHVGDLVVVVWHISCGTCTRCRAGSTGHCERVPPASAYGIGGPWGGLFDDVVRVPFADAMLTPLPAGLDPRDASVASDSLSLGPMITARNGALREEPIAILGNGEHGLYQVAFARDAGFIDITFVDGDEERRILAGELGAHRAVAAPRDAGGRFALIVDAAARAEWLRDIFAALAPEGIVECLAGHPGDLPIPSLLAYVNGATIRCGVGNNGPHVRSSLDAIARGVARPSTLWARTVEWDDLPDAFVDEPRKLFAFRSG